ncbi:MAG: hypothetical protein JRH20_31950 [Deltaproteobacteria bacterium]|nr:hypothetical protein [Deltaproteobacteria bacterium]
MTRHRPGTITISTRHDREKVFVLVQDTGRGLEPEALECLFDARFTTGASRVKLGMGLPISHQIVVQHGGELSVASTLGEGSTFTLALPKREQRG